MKELKLTAKLLDDQEAAEMYEGILGVLQKYVAQVPLGYEMTVEDDDGEIWRSSSFKPAGMK